MAIERDRRGSRARPLLDQSRRPDLGRRARARPEADGRPEASATPSASSVPGSADPASANDDRHVPRDEGSPGAAPLRAPAPPAGATCRPRRPCPALDGSRRTREQDPGLPRDHRDHLVDADQVRPQAEPPAAEIELVGAIESRLEADVLDRTDIAVRPLDPEPLAVAEPVVALLLRERERRPPLVGRVLCERANASSCCWVSRSSGGRNRPKGGFCSRCAPPRRGRRPQRRIPRPGARASPGADRRSARRLVRGAWW